MTPADQYILSLHESGSEAEERFEVQGSTTLGRHLENDLIVPGEDVLDYHLRVEPHERGLTIHPLSDATFELDGVEHSHSMGMVPGNLLVLGRTRIRLVEAPTTAEAERWFLVDAKEGYETAIPDAETRQPLSVGRGSDNLLRINDDHISRTHAELFCHGNTIWLRDASSANGSFVNGERVRGGCRLYHGDEVAFDAFKYQLIGRGGDLTPVREGSANDAGPPLILGADLNGNDTTEVAVTTPPGDDAVDITFKNGPTAAGCYLLGLTDPYQGEVFPTPLGRFIVGRDAKCDIVLSDPTVSSRHAKLVVRAENCSVTNLMATNGTRVNGQEVESRFLKDGDVIRLGQLRFIFRSIVDDSAHESLMQRLQIGLLAASAVLALALALLFLL